MSAKTVIQSLQDPDLIKLFLDFVQAHELSYEKGHKQISYKCYEASWILSIAKATGYGRTQTQAYKNALKNLLQLVMEDPAYIEYFSEVLTSISQNKYQTKDTSPPLKHHLKTEGNEPEAKNKNIYENGSKIHYLGKARQEIHHSKINLNRSISQKGDSQLDEAKKKLKILQSKLTTVLEENRILKEKLTNAQTKTAATTSKQPQDKKAIFESMKKQISLLSQNQHIQMSQKNLKQPEKSTASKILIPKLNLQVLPNYHKKSEKCLNELLLAAYNQKHGGADKRIL